MNAWNDSDDPFEWDGNTWGDSEKELEDSISGMTVRFFLLNNVQDYKRYTTPAEMVTAIVKLTGKTEMESYRQEIESLWDEYFKFKVQIKQNEINPEMDDFTREMEISFGCSDMMKKTEKVWAKLLVCEKPEGKENAPDCPDYIQKLVDKGLIQRDGKTAIKGLEKIADFMARELSMDVTRDLLYKQFIKKDGNPYSKRSCEDAASSVMNQKY